MRACVECRIKPYYLHHGDLAPGTAHLRTDIATGQELMRALRGRLSGLCQPTYVLDIPGGHGKSPIGPNYIARAGANGAAHFMVEDFNGRPARLSAGALAQCRMRPQVEQGRRQREAGEADEHDRDHGVPDEGHVAPQRRHHVFAFDHGLTLPGSCPDTHNIAHPAAGPFHNFCVNTAFAAACARMRRMSAPQNGAPCGNSNPCYRRESLWIRPSDAGDSRKALFYRHFFIACLGGSGAVRSRLLGKK